VKTTLTLGLLFLSLSAFAQGRLPQAAQVGPMAALAKMDRHIFSVRANRFDGRARRFGPCPLSGKCQRECLRRRVGPLQVPQ